MADAQTDLRAAIQGKNPRAATVVAELAGGSSARVLSVDDAAGVLAALDRASTLEWTLDDLLRAVATDGAEVGGLRRLFSPAQPPSAISALCGTRLWRPIRARPSDEADPARSPAPRGRRGRRGFIDEFLDHMGVHMYTVEGRAR